MYNLKYIPTEIMVNRFLLENEKIISLTKFDDYPVLEGKTRTETYVILTVEGSTKFNRIKITDIRTGGIEVLVYRKEKNAEIVYKKESFNGAYLVVEFIKSLYTVKKSSSLMNDWLMGC